jgi:hypothetical protein
MIEVKRQESKFHVYEQYRSQIKTGDVIAFSGNSGFSDFIKFFTKSKFSHVAIAVRDNSFIFGDTVFVVESTTEERGTNADGTKVIKGVQMHLLSQRLAMYNGSVYWFPLKQSIAEDKMQQMLSWLRNTYVSEVPYDYVQIYGAGLARIKREFLNSDFSRFGTPANYSRLFCSELVAKALKIADVIGDDEQFNPSKITPADVVAFDCLSAPIQLKPDTNAPESVA